MTVAQNEDEIAKLKQQIADLQSASKKADDDHAAEIEKLKKAKPAAAATEQPGRPQFKVKGAVDPKEGRKTILAGHSKKPKTYRALENGTDFKQGFIARGTIFTTTQPQGEWMEEVKPSEAADKADAE
jgi:uncharacterized coiled-coil protein SlyX